jgi:lipoate---protein ligase
MHGEYKVPGGKLVVVDCEVDGGRLHAVQISGDFFLEPPEALELLDRALDGVAVDESEDSIRDRLTPVVEEGVTLVGFDAAAIATAVRRALG